MKNKKVNNMIALVLLIVGIITLIVIFKNQFKTDNKNNDIKEDKKVVYAYFDKNGADSISSVRESCILSNGTCEITLPKINTTGVSLGWGNINSEKALYEENSKLKISKDITLYAITYKEFSISIVKDNVDTIDTAKLSCKAYNGRTGCVVDIPNYNTQGYETRGYSLFKDSLTGTIYPSKNYVITKSMTLYPVVNTLSHQQVINVSKSLKKYNVYFDIERGCSDLTVNTYFNYFDNINKYASYLLIGSKITFLNSNTFDNIWGSKYVGMNYGPNALRLFDVKCSNNILDNTNNYYATIVHELSHTWDFYYSNYHSKNISDETDFINIYTKYKNSSSRPFRDYSYSSIREFFADTYRYYYFKYIDPMPAYVNLDYPSDIKAILEKYICITNNGYINNGKCS